jgi:serine/threonine protein kinase
MAEERICPHCGKPVSSTAPGGVCPECMLKAGLAQTEGPGDRVPPPQPSEIAALFPQLEILECLGRGGMGVVYKARQPRLNRLIALKILAREKEQDGKFAERFAREAQALARLNHPNIVTVHDFGEIGGHCYLLMEFVDGLSLRQLLQSGTMKPDQALTIVPKICEALQYAHEQGIVHRDIKPENILLDKQGRVKIADFGIAKMIGVDAGQSTLTGAKEVMGTPHYMAPEQIEKPMEVDHRADIYSLGVVFYEMLTGELPLGKFQPPSTCAHALQMDVRLDEVVLRALAKEPARRYQQARVLKTEVETIATDRSHPVTIQERKKNMNTNKLVWIGLSIVAVCVALFVIALGLPILFRARASANPAQLTEQGWQQWQQRHLVEATESFRKAVKLDPKNANAWNGLGWASFNSGNISEAEQAFLKTVALEPNNPGGLNGLGQVYLVQKKYDTAETYLLKAAPSAPAAWFGLTRLYLIQEKYDQALPWAQKIVDSGQADQTANQMLEAAKNKKMSEALRSMIEPRSSF